MKVDTTAPSLPTVTFGNLSSGNTYDDGAGTLYYRPSPAGTFRVDASSGDAESGVQGYSFSPLGGFAGTSQSGGSLHVTFNGASTGSGAFTVHATNNAGTDSADATYNVTPDSTAPSGGGLTVNGTAATGAGSSSYLTSGGSVALSTTPYSDGGSGMQSEVVTVQQAALANDTCGSYGGPTTVGGATYGVSSGNCYLFTTTATDKVGNVATLQTTVKVDTTAPVTPSVVFSGTSAGNTFVSGSTHLLPTVGERHVHGRSERRKRSRDWHQSRKRRLHLLCRSAASSRQPRPGTTWTSASTARAPAAERSPSWRTTTPASRPALRATTSSRTRPRPSTACWRSTHMPEAIPLR